MQSRWSVVSYNVMSKVSTLSGFGAHPCFSVGRKPKATYSLTKRITAWYIQNLVRGQLFTCSFTGNIAREEVYPVLEIIHSKGDFNSWDAVAIVKIFLALQRFVLVGSKRLFQQITVSTDNKSKMIQVKNQIRKIDRQCLL